MVSVAPVAAEPVMSVLVPFIPEPLLPFSAGPVMALPTPLFVFAAIEVEPRVLSQPMATSRPVQVLELLVDVVRAVIPLSVCGGMFPTLLCASSMPVHIARQGIKICFMYRSSCRCYWVQSPDRKRTDSDSVTCGARNAPASSFRVYRIT